MKVHHGLIAGMALALSATTAIAHSWYPWDCCSDNDCAPVQAASYLTQASSSSPVLIVKTIHGVVAVPADFPQKESKDGQMHACMRKEPDGSMKLLCLFMPPST